MYNSCLNKWEQATLLLWIHDHAPYIDFDGKFLERICVGLVNVTLWI